MGDCLAGLEIKSEVPRKGRAYSYGSESRFQSKDESEGWREGGRNGRAVCGERKPSLQGQERPLGGEREQKSDWGRAHTALSRKIETKLSNAALP